jgi:transitional endoplasmic reticulum ATPase
MSSIASRTAGYTGADLEDLVRRAGLLALRENLLAQSVSMRLFEAALLETRASVTEELEKEYRDLADTLKREHPRGPRRIGFATGLPVEPPKPGEE